MFRNLKVYWERDLIPCPFFTTWLNLSGRRVIIIGKLVISYDSWWSNPDAGE